MKDWKEIINKIIGWGFLATFAILGIALVIIGTVKDSHLNNDTQLACMICGAILALAGVGTYLAEFLIKQKTLTFKGQIKELEEKMSNLETKIDTLTSNLQTLRVENAAQSATIEYQQKELDRKQAKLDKKQNQEK